MMNQEAPYRIQNSHLIFDIQVLHIWTYYMNNEYLYWKGWRFWDTLVQLRSHRYHGKNWNLSLGIVSVLKCFTTEI